MGHALIVPAYRNTIRDVEVERGGKERSDKQEGRNKTHEATLIRSLWEYVTLITACIYLQTIHS